MARRTTTFFLVEHPGGRRFIDTRHPGGPTTDGPFALLAGTPEECKRLMHEWEWVRELAAKNRLENLEVPWRDCAVLLHFAGGTHGCSPSIHTVVHRRSVELTDEQGRTQFLEDGHDEEVPSGALYKLTDRDGTASIMIGSMDRFQQNLRAVAQPPQAPAFPPLWGEGAGGMELMDVDSSGSAGSAGGGGGGGGGGDGVRGRLLTPGVAPPSRRRPPRRAAARRSPSPRCSP